MECHSRTEKRRLFSVKCRRVEVLGESAGLEGLLRLDVENFGCVHSRQLL
ncbi:MAG: hypothetical protein KatS3mg077_1078 [Candidatus Binatia bacterium]|nr:MAG: hypothetical protein KatS3mg077_1078 [Candidatus Binatia bacterium]